MQPVKGTPAVTPGDRLGMLLFLGVMFHGLIILGIGFSPPESQRNDLVPTLDIILVQGKSSIKPEEADYLAQASQEGGGTVEKKTRPSQPVKGSAPNPSKSLNKKPARKPSSKPVVDHKKSKVITSEKSRNIVLSKPDITPEKKQVRQEDTRKLIKRSLEIASLTEEINTRIEHYAKRPRRKFINARTREFAPAAYMSAWVRKVERIGNLNYPDEARRQKLSGVLRLTVIIRKDGKVEKIILDRSSGHPVLDDAAIRIVRLGAPYAPIPDNIKEEGEPVKFLHITRTWEFLSSNTWRDRGK